TWAPGTRPFPQCIARCSNACTPADSTLRVRVSIQRPHNRARPMNDSSSKSCCARQTHPGITTPTERDRMFLDAALAVPDAPQSVREALRANLKVIPGGIYEMGARKSTFHDDHDSPRRKVKISPFL